MSAAPARGFVLTPTYRMRAGRAAVHLYAVLDDGTPALITDDRLTPYCFVRAADAGAAALRGFPVEPTPLTTFAGVPVSRVSVAVPGDLTALRRRLIGASVPVYEADLRYAYRWLIDHDVRAAFTVDGAFEVLPGLGRVYHNPTVAPAAWTPRLRVLSLDIETSMDAGQVWSIAVAGHGGEHVWMVGDAPVAGATVVPDERALVEAFVTHVRTADPDVLTGWNVCDFDLTVLRDAAHRGGLRLLLGRDDDEVEIQRDQSFTREARAVMNGRIVLDGLALMRSAFIRLDDYRLETAARTLLGKGKLFGPDHRGAAIAAAYRDDPASLVAYNLEDARLVLEILEKTGLVELTVRRSLQTGMQLDRVSAQIAAIDSLYLRALRARGHVAPSVDADRRDAAPITGGLVLESRPGLYRNILVFDFKSLYPSLIRTFNIDPLTYVDTPVAGTALQTSPSGAAFRRDEPGILPALVAKLWEERAQARAAGDATGAQATKILMNSLFGVLGSPASRLFSPDVANAITVAGQHVIRLAAAAATARGHTVVYGDTDSLFLDVGVTDTDVATALGARLRDEIDGAVADSLKQDFGCTSHLELEFEKVYARFFMPEVRGGATGSKKRYAGLVGGALEITGLEAVRRDWSAVARRFQRELLLRVLQDEPVADFVREFVKALRASTFDGELAYRKAVRKALASYTRTTPAHVKAARKPGATGGRIVTYVVTRNGPEPVEALTAPPDHEHYVTQQLRPLADAILRFAGEKEFDELIGAPRQLSLF
ncbi:MAG TPA: DNA polymerase II [Candidatus Binatia bacterium]|nr:DNA polymerase II [Candidatus Binatia bacterium]